MPSCNENPARQLLIALNIAFLHAVVLSMLLPLYAGTKPHYTFILPDGYIGWIQVIFNDPQTPRLPVEKNGGRVLEVPESGIFRTSDLRVHDFKRKDEFYYRVLLPGGRFRLQAVPAEYILSDDSH